MRERSSIALEIRGDGSISSEVQQFYSASFDEFARRLGRYAELPDRHVERQCVSREETLINKAYYARFRVYKRKNEWTFGFATGYQKCHSYQGGDVRILTESEVGLRAFPSLEDFLEKNPRYHDIGLNAEGKRCFMVDSPSLNKSGWDIAFCNNTIYVHKV
jgi:hypothetical protein